MRGLFKKTGEILQKWFEIGNTVYNRIFFKEINSDETFPVSEDCLYGPQAQNFFFTSESVDFHSADCLFNSIS